MDLPIPVSRQHALHAGYTDRELAGRGWTRVRRGQYVDATTANQLDVEQRHLVAARAAAAHSHPEAVVSHVSAALAHGLPVWGVPLNRVHLTRNRRTGARRSRQVVLHSAALDPAEVVVLDGLRVTTVARTVVDLARSVPVESAVVVGDAALRSGAVTRADLERQLARTATRRASPAARRVVERLDGRSESPGESRSRVAMVHRGLPDPELQARVLDDRGDFVGRVDFLFAQLGVIGEFDGRVKYGSAAADEVFAEKVREDRLRALGWLVVRWTWADLDAARWLERIEEASGIAAPVRLGSWAPT